MSTIKTPQPGIYEVPADPDYHGWELVSSSRAKLAFRSMAHFKAGFTGEPTKAMTLGTFCHGGFFEPLTLLETTVYEPNWAEDPRNVTTEGARAFRKTKWTDQMSAQFRELNANKTILPEKDYHRVRGVARALSSCPIVKELTAKGKPEQSIVWIDPATQLACKSRLDWLRVDGERVLLMDLKTCADASRFEQSIVSYHYHFQMAFYRRAVEVATGYTPEVWVCAIEPTEPFGHRVARMDPDALALGEREVDRILALIAECKETDTWPSYSHPEAWRLPEWYTKKTAEPIELILDDGEAILV